MDREARSGLFHSFPRRNNRIYVSSRGCECYNVFVNNAPYKSFAEKEAVKLNFVVTPGMLLMVCGMVFLASVVDSIGGGGGLISLPAYLLTGLDPVLAAGSNKFSASFGTLIATIRYFRSGRLLVKQALWAVLGALPGAYAGAEVLERTNPAFVRGFMLCAIPVMAVVMLLKKDAPEQAKREIPVRPALCLLIGLCIGFYDGFFGPGTGTLLILAFTWLTKMDMVTASGTAKAVNLASNVAALFSLLTGGHVVFALSVPAMFCSMAGGWVGSKLAITRGAKLIRWVMLGVLTLLLIRLAWDWLR